LTNYYRCGGFVGGSKNELIPGVLIRWQSIKKYLVYITFEKTFLNHFIKFRKEKWRDLLELVEVIKI